MTTIHDMDDIEFTPYEDTDWREERLKLTLAYAMGITRSRLPISEIVEMRDEKGELVVVWKSEAAFKQWNAPLNQAWNDFACEPYTSHENATGDMIIRIMQEY